MTDEQQIRQQRSTLLSVLFTILGSVGTLAFSFLLCGGVTLNVLGVIVGVALLGLVHYWLWGRAMMGEVEVKNEPEAIYGEMIDETWTWQGPNGPLRL